MKDSASKAHRHQEASSKRVEKTADGHHVIIDGRKWRATNPDLPEDKRQQLVNDLMKARRDVGNALKSGDKEAEKEARHRVNEAKVALGERGPKWWEQSNSEASSPDKPPTDSNHKR